MSTVEMCDFALIGVTSRGTIEWYDPDPLSLILKILMHRQALQMHPIMIKWEGKSSKRNTVFSFGKWLIFELFAKEIALWVWNSNHVSHEKFHTRLLLFFSNSCRRASYASNRDKFAHKALRLVNDINLHANWLLVVLHVLGDKY